MGSAYKTRADLEKENAEANAKVAELTEQLAKASDRSNVKDHTVCDRERATLRDTIARNQRAHDALAKENASVKEQLKAEVSNYQTRISEALGEIAELQKKLASSSTSPGLVTLTMSYKRGGETRFENISVQEAIGRVSEASKDPAFRGAIVN